ncbi:hypothetical protein H2201_001694 [Coniosporium apollinis]|uniref:F-box domain-containing protein n=2 Tax=Coniosporium TaxID=2810619 RepID=A0ABQ9P0Z9_9PEZI|nr:hypothetical protein H2199_007583 [Cladosporium sp. JES 115]KAJ9668264.1 hypothetical protein H2201_001694 [Coniosporium apollinis]
MQDAIGEVLNTVELLENILLFVDPRTVCRSQRVSVPWRNTISKSLSIQRMLLLALPAGGAVRPVRRAIAADSVTTIPVYAEDILLPNEHNIGHHINPALKRDIWSPRITNYIDGQFYISCRVVIGTKGKAQEVRFPGWNYSLWNSLHIHTVGTDRNSFDRCSSWKRMFITQPPCTTTRMYVEVSSYNHPGDGLIPFEFRRYRTVQKDGITYGDLLDELGEEILDIWTCIDPQARMNGVRAGKIELSVHMKWFMLDARTAEGEEQFLAEEEHGNPRDFDDRYVFILLSAGTPST